MQHHDLDDFPWLDLMHNSHLFQPEDEQPLVEESFLTRRDGQAPLWNKVVSKKVRASGSNHGERNTENQLVTTSKYVGVTCEMRNGLIWWRAERVDPSTGLSVVGAVNGKRYATEELDVQVVSSDRLPPDAPAPPTGHHLLRSAINDECTTSVPFNAMEANRVHTREFHAGDMSV